VHNFGEQGFCEPFLIRRVMVYDMEPLLADVRDQTLDLALIIISFYETKIQNSAGGGRNYVASERTDIAAAHPINIERRFVDQLEQALTRIFCSRQAELRFESLSYCGASSIARRSVSPRGAMSSYQPAMVTRPASSFIELSSFARIKPGFGDQFP
jgi:hypothetical protein